jgi:hypothetical protein
MPALPTRFDCSGIELLFNTNTYSSILGVTARLPAKIKIIFKKKNMTPNFSLCMAPDSKQIFTIINKS